MRKTEQDAVGDLVGRIGPQLTLLTSGAAIQFKFSRNVAVVLVWNVVANDWKLLHTIQIPDEMALVEQLKVAYAVGKARKPFNYKAHWPVAGCRTAANGECLTFFEPRTNTSLQSGVHLVYFHFDNWLDPRPFFTRADDDRKHLAGLGLLPLDARGLALGLKHSSKALHSIAPAQLPHPQLKFRP